MSKRVLGLCLWLLCSLALSEAPVNVGQLVIVYSPLDDHSGVLDGLREDLDALFRAAEKKKMRVVLVNARDVSKPKLNETLGQLVDKENSWVVVAAHGRQVADGDSASRTDTRLSLLGGIVVKDIQEALKRPNAKGVMLASCHSFNTIFSESSPVACGASAGNKETNTETIRSVSDALATIMATEGPVAVGPELEKAVKKLAATDPILVADEKSPLGRIPVCYKPFLPRYSFAGKKFEVVDLNGKPSQTCPGICDKDEKMRMLPGKYRLDCGLILRPDAAFDRADNSVSAFPSSKETDRLFDLAKNDAPWWKGAWFECKAGKWKFEPPDCTGKVKFSADGCEKAYEKIPADWKKVATRERWSRDCAAVNDDYHALEKMNVGMPKEFCLSGCPEPDLLQPGTIVQEQLVPPYGCSSHRDGSYCHFNFSFRSVTRDMHVKECCGTGHRWDELNKLCTTDCFDTKSGKSVAVGACFSSDTIPAGRDAQGNVVYDPDPIFKCTSFQEPIDNGFSSRAAKKGVPDAECCNRLPNRKWDNDKKRCLFLKDTSTAPRQYHHIAPKN